MTLGVLWDYFEGTSGVTLGMDWGHFEGALESLWSHFRTILGVALGLFEGTLGLFGLLPGALVIVSWG